MTKNTNPRHDVPQDVGQVVFQRLDVWEHQALLAHEQRTQASLLNRTSGLWAGQGLLRGVCHSASG